ncbi:MAG TPA: M20/M25/M40 family metallo-hydrolase [Pyrinomonadaceae bacterium]|nr:M20/M25/M40 family metallo-hydrolase [Pyrinomonadaceae bacterium]
MSKRRIAALLLCTLPFTNLPARAQTPAPSAPQTQTAQAPTPTPTPTEIDRIKDEGLNRSQVMQTLSYLTDVIGPRLTNSPGMKRANEWTRDKLMEWGLQNARLEAWGPFGRGWTLKRFSAEVVEPQTIPLIAYPKAWSPGLASPLNAEVVYLDATKEEELQKFRGQLRGKIVLTSPVREVRAHFDAEAVRLTEKQLLDLANAPDPATRPARAGRQQTPEQRAAAAFNTRRLSFLNEEGAALLVDPGRGDGGNIFVGGVSVPQPAPAPTPAAPATARRTFRAWETDAPKFAPQLVLAVEHYNRLARMIQQGERVRMNVNLDVEYQDKDLMGYNTIAEIPGSDLKDEVVMLGAHLDSWHGGTGATDNAAGCAVVMEAVRILKALNLQPRRTVRIALWSGEEQGLLGSRAYVKEHFGELVTPSPTPTPDAPADAEASPTPAPTAPASQARLVTKPEYEKFSAYYNLDNGTGRIRGVYMQGNEGVRSLFRQWLQPFADLGAQTLTLSNTGSTDHVPFDTIGLPGFQFIQDGVEYGSRTHHSTQDLYDRLQADDMKQASVVMAAFIYQTAMLNERLPRKAPPGAGRR